MILHDTREQKNAHILAYLDREGVPHRLQKLDTGDYMLEGREDLTIDRKQNLDEVCGNLFSRNKGRFWREVRRAKSERKKMIVLVEHGGQIRTLEDVKGYKSRFSKVSGSALYNEICRCSIAYGVEFLFCSKAETGKRIVELLGEKRDE